MTKILIDLQACQTQSRLRGMGRYARDLTKAMIKIAGDDHQIHLLANAGLKASLLDIVNQFQHLVPEGHLHLVKLPKNVDLNNPLKNERAGIAGAILEGFVESLAPDVYFCPAFFEGFIDDAVTSAGKFTSVPIVATIHDLIPLLRPKQYLDPHPDYKRVYLEKLEELRQVAGLIAISESSRGEAIAHLEFDENRVCNASEAADHVFRPVEITDERRRTLFERFGIKAPFLLYTGGADPRKNLIRLLDAFSALPQKLKDQHQLVLAGKMPEFERNELLARAKKLGVDDKLVFTGYICDEDLIALFNLTELFVFPSEHEGFGLPPLESMQCGAATIGSNCSSVPEVVARADAQFNPQDVKALCALITKVLSDAGFKAELQKWGREHAKSFNWETSAELALSHISKFEAGPKQDLCANAQLERLNTVTEELTEKVVMMASTAKLSEAEISGFLQNIADNQTHLHFVLSHHAPRDKAWRIEGPVDSSYSLAIVNRELARALAAEGEDIALWSSEGPGDFEADPAFLNANPDIKSMVERGHIVGAFEAGIVSRNMYPPRVADCAHASLALHNYAWEESVIPQDFVQGFNEYTQFITATSAHTKKVLIDNGVQAPIDVVYNGIDHGLDIVPDPEVRIDAKSFRFLHVSSCFPRKGADILLKAYFDAFTADDDVSLIIKTFSNPHNQIQEQLNALRQRVPNPPDVQLIFNDLSDAALKALYGQCDVLVAPSRAEGFGLPIAEAMLEGMYVLTTGWSGQLDLALEGQVEWIDFDYARAQTHELSWDSIWAEPSQIHLSRLLQAAANTQHDRQALKQNAQQLLDKLSWQQVAKNNIQSKQNLRRRLDLPKVGWVTTYRKKCGIATYSEHLLEHFDAPVVILSDVDAQLFYEDRENVVPCWKEGIAEGGLDELYAQIKTHKLDIVLFQFNYGFFAFEAFNALLLKLKRDRVTVVVVLHATIDPAHDPKRKLAMLQSGLSQCDRLIVHSVHDLNRLKALQLDHNATLVPHGCLTIANPDVDKQWDMPRPGEHLTIASYGFFLPNKGLLSLIKAVAKLNTEGQKCRLIMVNAEFPAPISPKLIKEAKTLIQKLGIERLVRMHTDFLSDQESFDKINMADLLVYPYEGTGESASGAVRYGLASGKPVLVSNSPIFDDVRDIVYTIDGDDADAIAFGVKAFLQDADTARDKIADLQARAQHWRHNHGYPNIARRLEGMVKALHFENEK